MDNSSINLNEVESFTELSSNDIKHKADAASFMLDRNQHTSPITLQISGIIEKNVSLQTVQITQQIKNSWQDIAEATEEGASGIAMILIHQYTDFQVSERAAKGTGIDYWLKNKKQAKNLNSFNLFENQARLEISGIENGTKQEVQQRLREKKKQTKQSEATKLPAFVVIVEFSTPCSALEGV